MPTKDLSDLASLHDVYVDGQLKSIEYHRYKLEYIMAELDRVKMKLSTGCVSSTEFKSPEEAFYITSPKPAGNANFAELILEETELDWQYRQHAEALEELCSELSCLSEEELELLHIYYEKHTSAEEIAYWHFREKKYVLRRLVAIREKLWTD